MSSIHWLRRAKEPLASTATDVCLAQWSGIASVETMRHFPVSANGSSFDSELFAVDRKIGITADIGLLLGATEATPDLTVKWDLGISF